MCGTSRNDTVHATHQWLTLYEGKILVQARSVQPVRAKVTCFNTVFTLFFFFFLIYIITKLIKLSDVLERLLISFYSDQLGNKATEKKEEKKRRKVANILFLSSQGTHCLWWLGS